LIILKTNRWRALSRALLFAMPAALFGAASFKLYASLEFVPSGASNRIVEYGWAALGLPLVFLAVYSSMQAVRWAALGLWPGPNGVFADERGLEFRLGPARRRYEAAELRIRYPFDLLDESEEAPFEAFLPEEEQLAKFLPRITHPQSTAPLNLIILRYVEGTEAQVASRLRPMLDVWRGTQGGSPED